MGLCVCELCLLPTFNSDVPIVLRICDKFVILCVAVWYSAGEMANRSPPTELGDDDLKVLYNSLYRIRRKYASLGIQLGLKKSEIDDIEDRRLDPGKSLLEVLSIKRNLSPGVIFTHVGMCRRRWTSRENKEKIWSPFCS